MKKKSLAFTLAEVLIALTVIGAVAALVLPQLLLGQKSAQAKSQFNTAYSIIEAAIARMDADNVSLKPASYANATAFYNVFKKYNKVSHDCGTSGTCDPKPAYSNITPKGAFILNNNMLVVLEDYTYVPPEEPLWGNVEFPNKRFSLFSAAYASPPIRPPIIIEAENLILINVDINGNNKTPNKLGYDVFTFQLVDGDIVPVGSERSFTQETCNRKSSSKEVLMACSQDAATDGDYFKSIYNNR